MVNKLLFLEKCTGAGYNTSKPKTLYRYEPITITLTPAILMAGLIVVSTIVLLAFGSIENYNLLLSGV